MTFAIKAKQMEAITLETLPKAFTHLFDKVENIERLLQTRTEQGPEADELLSIQQAADFLKLSVPTLYRMVSRSAIPVIKRGKRLYFSKQTLAAWVKKSPGKERRKVQAAAKTDIGRKAKGIKRGGHTKQTLCLKYRSKKRFKPGRLSYKREKNKVEISGDAKDIKGLIWTDSTISWLWKLFIVVLVLIRC